MLVFVRTVILVHIRPILVAAVKIREGNLWVFPQHWAAFLMENVCLGRIDAGMNLVTS